MTLSCALEGDQRLVCARSLASVSKKRERLPSGHTQYDELGEQASSAVGGGISGEVETAALAARMSTPSEEAGTLDRRTPVREPAL